MLARAVLFCFVLSTELYLSACEGRFFWVFCFKYRTVYDCLLGQFLFVCLFFKYKTVFECLLEQVVCLFFVLEGVCNRFANFH